MVNCELDPNLLIHQVSYLKKGQVKVANKILKDGRLGNRQSETQNVNQHLHVVMEVSESQEANSCYYDTKTVHRGEKDDRYLEKFSQFEDEALMKEDNNIIFTDQDLDQASQELQNFHSLLREQKLFDNQEKALDDMNYFKKGSEIDLQKVVTLRDYFVASGVLQLRKDIKHSKIKELLKKNKQLKQKMRKEIIENHGESQGKSELYASAVEEFDLEKDEVLPNNLKTEGDMSISKDINTDEIFSDNFEIQLPEDENVIPFVTDPVFEMSSEFGIGTGEFEFGLDSGTIKECDIKEYMAKEHQKGTMLDDLSVNIPDFGQLMSITGRHNENTANNHSKFTTHSMDLNSIYVEDNFMEDDDAMSAIDVQDLENNIQIRTDFKPIKNQIQFMSADQFYKRAKQFVSTGKKLRDNFERKKFNLEATEEFGQ